MLKVTSSKVGTPIQIYRALESKLLIIKLVTVLHDQNGRCVAALTVAKDQGFI